MQQSELDANAPGELVSLGRRSYYKPDPLPPSRDLDLGDDFYERLSEATFWLGKLSGVSLELDFPPVLYTSLLRKEAMESARIEGADVDYDALYSLETRSFDAGDDEVGEVDLCLEAAHRRSLGPTPKERAVEGTV